jgi:acyl dehydratase
MAGLYYEDFVVGGEHQTPGRTITESDIVQFAALTGDWNPVHTDEESGKRGPYGTRIAHGLFGLSLIEGLKFRLGHFDGTAIASLSWNIRFALPIKIGDTLHVRVKIASKRETKKRDRGIVVEFTQLCNQRGEVVTEGEHVVMVVRKPA